MSATVKIEGKKVLKVLGAACLATGVVALSAVVASGAAVGAVAEGFRTARNTMRQILKKEENEAAGEGSVENSAETDNEIAVGTTVEAVAEDGGIEKKP